MDKLLFGISGLPLGNGTAKFTYKTGIDYLSSIGLDAMELPFVRSVNVTSKNKDGIIECKTKNDFYLSAHGSCFINLNADDLEKQEAALYDLHIHMSGVNYCLKGEKNHLPFLESDFPYKACIKSFIKFNVKGCIICESPLLEKDALLLKEIYSN